MCVMISVKFHSERAGVGVLDVLRMVHCLNDNETDINSMNIFMERYEMHILRSHSVFSHLQENSFSVAVRHLEQMTTSENADAHVLRMCTKVVLFFYYQLGTRGETECASPGRGIAVLVLACLQCAEGHLLLRRHMADKHAVQVANIFSQHSADMYIGTRITLGGLYVESSSREAAITSRTNVLSAHELILASSGYGNGNWQQQSSFLLANLACI